MADMQSPQHPLEVLPAMLNLVLLQTAKILRNPECRNLKQAGLTKRRITEIVTVANQRFHDALDEVEVDILRAKAVMERDLRSIRKQRAEKDRANEVVIEPGPLQESVVPVANDSANLRDLLAVDSAGENPEASGVWNESATDRLAEELKETDAVGAENESQEAISTEHDMPQDSENSIGLAISIPSGDTSGVSGRPENAEKSAEAVAPLDAPLEISDAVDIDFESMLNDTDPKTIDDALNFDFELSTDPAMTQDMLNSTDFSDVNISNTEVTNLPNNTNEDIDSLLPGVENYLNTDTDFSNITIPPAALTSGTSQPPVMGTTVTSAQSTAGEAITETSFDDNFFGLGNFELNETGGDELGDGTLGDFEDFDWS